MAKYKLEIVIKLEIETELDTDAAMDEIAAECSYDFPSTDNVKVVKTEWFDTSVVN